VPSLLQKVLDQFGKQFTWDLKAKQMGLKALASAQVSLLRGLYNEALETRCLDM
jgi:hypothetical protein